MIQRSKSQAGGDTTHSLVLCGGRTWLRYGSGVACDEVRYRTSAVASVAFPSRQGGGGDPVARSKAESSGAKSVQAAPAWSSRAWIFGGWDVDQAGDVELITIGRLKSNYTLSHGARTINAGSSAKRTQSASTVKELLLRMASHSVAGAAAAETPNISNAGTSSKAEERRSWRRRLLLLLLLLLPPIVVVGYV